MRFASFAVVLLAAVLVAGSAQGVTPGKNGLIYFENFDEGTAGSDIFAINPNGSGLQNLTKSQDIDETEPAASPNGSLVAFVSNQGSDAFHLRVMNKDGSGVRALPGGAAEHGSPAWSPNGRQIAFSRCTTLDADTGDCTNAQIAVIGADGQNLKVLTTRVTGAVDSRPAWAPDGKALVFQRTNADGIVSLWTVSATGSSIRRILNDGSDVDRNPSFTPNGREVIYFSDVGGHEGIWQVNPNGHAKKKLFTESPDPDDPTTGAGTENPAVSPNGKQFVYVAGGDLWLAAINGTNRTQLTKDGGDEPDWARG